MYLYLTCLGGYRERETPGPIPNPEAKPLIADNTAGFTCGNVGRCLVCLFTFLINQIIFTSLKIIYMLLINYLFPKNALFYPYLHHLNDLENNLSLPLLRLNFLDDLLVLGSL